MKLNIQGRFGFERCNAQNIAGREDCSSKAPLGNSMERCRLLLSKGRQSKKVVWTQRMSEDTEEENDVCRTFSRSVPSALRSLDDEIEEMSDFDRRRSRTQLDVRV